MVLARQISEHSIEIEVAGVVMIADGNLCAMSLDECKALVRQFIETLIALEGETDEMQILRRKYSGD
jgi:hypothetical protein